MRLTRPGSRKIPSWGDIFTLFSLVKGDDDGISLEAELLLGTVKGGRDNR